MNRFRNIRRMEPFQGPSKWVPTLGELQKTLQKGEYLPLRPLPMFESNFVQVTNRGAPVYVHHRTNRLTMGVAASLPGLVLPDILLIAQPGEGRECSNLVLTRMLPLDLAHLYVHDLSAWRLKLRLVTGRYYYLELDAPDNEAGFLFDRWIRLINLLHEPATTWAPRTLSTPAMDLAHVAPPASTWRLQAQPQSKRSVMIVEPTFPYKLMTSQRQKKTKALKRRFKSQAVGDSVPLILSQGEHTQAKKRSAERSHPKLHLDTSQTKIQVSEKPSITIRTIFSIISNTINHTQSSSKAAIYWGPNSGYSSDSEVGTVLGGLVETPVRCISEEGQEPSLRGSYDCLDTYLWQQDIENLMDPDSSTLSSSSFGPAPSPPAFYLPTAFSSVRKRKGKAWQRPRPPRSQRTPSTRAASSKVPFILDQSKKVSAMHAPTQKTSAPGQSRRAPAVPAAPQKVPVARGLPRKAVTVATTSLKAPPAHSTSRKAPPTAPVSPKAPPALSTSRKAPLASAVSRKAPASPVLSRKAAPVLASPEKPPGTPFPSQKSLPILALPPKAVSPTLRKKKSLFIPSPSRKAVTSPSQYKMTPDKADFGPRPQLGPRRDAPERKKHEGVPQPMLFVGTQEMDVLETRTQRTSMELPFTTTKKRSEEVMISKAREITLDGLKGRGTLEDKVHKKKEKISLDMPGFKSKERGEQQRWLKTQELAIEGGQEEQSRPFSVEGLTLAKMMIMANCKEPPQRPAAVGLPSWYSAPQASVSMEGTVPFSPRHVPSPEGNPVAARKQSPLGFWVPSPERKPVGVREQSPLGSWVPLMEGSPVGVREQFPVGSWVPSPERKPVGVREQSPLGSWVPLMEGSPVGVREQFPVGSWVPSPERKPVGIRELSPLGSWVPLTEGSPAGVREQSPLSFWVPSMEGSPAGARKQSPVGSLVPSTEGTLVGVREQSAVGSGVKGKMHQCAERSKQPWVEEEANVEELSQDTVPSEVPYLLEKEMNSVSSSQKMDNVSQSPTPLPALEGEDTTRSPILLTPILEVEAGSSPPLSSVSQEPQEPKEMSDLSPVNATGLSSEGVSPLAVESMMDMAANGEQTEEQDVVSPSASMLSTESPQ